MEHDKSQYFRRPSLSPERPLISIIIPARNDAAALRLTLDYLQQLPRIADAEILIAASGNREDVERAVADRAQLLWPVRCTRSALMNAAAQAARGDILFFLHADSLPPPDSITQILLCCREPMVVGGAFEHRFQEPLWSLRTISWINRRRYRITRNYYGDQGIFLRADVFRSMGGYRDLGLMEDLDFEPAFKAKRSNGADWCAAHHVRPAVYRTRAVANFRLHRLAFGSPHYSV